jgi:glycosyltransferase involved in cell wall biosynthesis
MAFQARAGDDRLRISVVIPALNEARNLPHVFSLVPDDVHELILVDGHSLDGSVRIARELRPDVRVVMQTRTGKGNALACGFIAATGDIIVTIDADGSADPGEIPLFVKALTEGADFAKGTRFSAGGKSHDITRLRRFGNSMLSGLVNLLYGTRYTDLCYGLNAFWKPVVPILGLDATALAPSRGNSVWGDGFEIETLINIRAAQAGLAITEVPSIEHARIHGVSNLNAFRDGLRVLRTIVYERLTARRPSPAPATRAPSPHSQPGTRSRPLPQPARDR